MSDMSGVGQWVSGLLQFATLSVIAMLRACSP